MSALKDLTGQRFGRLTVIERAENSKKGQARWNCLCDCGNFCVVDSRHLLSNATRSCGCFNKEIATKRASTHRMRGTKIYKKWCSLKNRCFNRNDKAYRNYGGRGISVYPEWIDNFQAFYDYVSQLEHFGEEGYSLDRIDNDGNYEPNNLRWADNETQQRNRRNTIFVEYNGRKISLVEVAELIGIPYKTIYFRYHKGDRGEKLFRPLKKSPLPAFRKA